MPNLEHDYYGIEAGWDYIFENPNALEIPFEPAKASRAISLYLQDAIDEEDRAKETMKFDVRFNAINSRRAQEEGARIYLLRSEFEIVAKGLLALKAERDQLKIDT